MKLKNGVSNMQEMHVHHVLGDGDSFWQFKALLGLDNPHGVEVRGGLKGVRGVMSVLEHHELI